MEEKTVCTYLLQLSTGGICDVFLIYLYFPLGDFKISAERTRLISFCQIPTCSQHRENQNQTTGQRELGSVMVRSQARARDRNRELWWVTEQIGPKGRTQSRPCCHTEVLAPEITLKAMEKMPGFKGIQLTRKRMQKQIWAPDPACTLTLDMPTNAILNYLVAILKTEKRKRWN